MKNQWDVPNDKKDKYIKKCKLFVESDDAFKDFRTDKDYGQILEGNEDVVAQVALAYIVQHGGSVFVDEHYDQFILNDSVGNPRVFDNGISPATLRYINSAYEITKLLGRNKPKRILEIGGGYGGLCRILSVVYNFEEYTNVDLPEAEALFNKYISYFPALNGKVNNIVRGKYDLFIADSSLSECSSAAQLKYFKMASKCDYVFIVYNTFHIKDNERLLLKSFKEMFKNFTISKVPPITTQRGEESFANTYLLVKKK